MKNVSCLNYLGSIIANDALRRRDIKSRIVVAKAAFTEMRTPFTSQEDLQSSKALRLEHRFVWC